MPIVIPAQAVYDRPCTENAVAFCITNELPYCEGVIIECLCRWREGGGFADLRKARAYLDRLIRREVDHTHE